MNGKISRKTAVHGIGLLLWGALYLVTGSPCWFQAVLGVPCPGCGSTRAALELLRFRFAPAHAWHPLIIPSLVLLMYFAVRFLFFRRAPALNAEKYVLLSAAVVYLAVFAIRMALLFPHTQPLVPSESALWRQALRLITRIVDQ